MATLATMLVLGACHPAALEPPARDASPAFSFQNGPAELPYVIRLELRLLLGWRDPASNLAVIVGAPDDPLTSVRCGGTEPAEFLPMQFVGELFGLAGQLALDQRAHVLVYEGLTATLDESLCGKTPVASGIVTYVRTDNDFFGAFGRANAFSERVHGVVTLAAGGTASLSARLWGHGSPEGELLAINSAISLVPHGPGAP